MQARQKKGALGDLVDHRTGDVDGYEQLRRCALDGEPSGWRLGFGVLAARGIAGWLRVWHTNVPIPRPLQPLAVPESGVGSEQLVGVLASMALACVDQRR
ncbi:MAG: hypothetical protein M5U23_04560 [Acidimicrobiia bacterium]|nr:hypothetical protein [Acidimicrobiia bacterium]